MIRIVKLGGSVITREDAERPFDADTVARLAQELAPFSNGIVLTHGTGHVGKPFASKYNFVRSGRVAANQQALAAEIRNALRGLNVEVVDALRHAGIPAYGVQPSVFFDEQMQDLRFPEFEQAMLQQMRSGHVPVFFGDLMPLASGDFQVFSSDRMTAILARKLNPQSVIFLSDVAGVFGSDADGQRRSQPLACIKPDTLDEIFVDAGDGSDVSGGMRGKVELALSAAKHSGRCVIANGLEHGLLAGLLSGDSVPCTEVRAV